MRFVLDATVTLAWAFEDEGGFYPEAVLDTLVGGEAVAPSHWPLEVSNGLLTAQRRGRLGAADTARFSRLLLALPVVVEPVDPKRVFEIAQAIGQRREITTYDAEYLELATRFGIPLATLDDGLRSAAESEGIRIHLR